LALSDRIAGQGLVRRIISSLVLAPLALAAVYYGTPWLELMLIAAAVQMAREWSMLCDNGRAMPGGLVLGIGAVIGILLASQLGMTGALWTVVATAIVAFAVGHKRGHTAATWLAAGAPVVALPCLAFLWLRFGTADGVRICFWLLAAVWATDIAAYAVGRTVGGPKLWPKVSPKKTWSGLIGGVVGAGIVGYVTAWVLGSDRGLALVVTGFVVAVVAQAGDLSESAVKRHFGVKDAGQLIPGHGGVLDRVDGLITAAPAMAVAVWLFGGEVFPWK